MSESGLRDRFDAVNDLLSNCLGLWAAQPFKHQALPWEADRPELSRALRRLSDPELEDYENHPARARRFLARWLPREVDRCARVEPDELEEGDIDLDDDAPREGIPARKWEQIRRFAQRVPRSDLPILEWCSGKGHLGHLLSEVSGQPVRCVERDERLAHSGRQIAEESALPVDFAVLDALDGQAGSEIVKRQLACALHACGRLHIRLMELASNRGTLALVISPCCYHLIEEQTYRPLSRPARESPLQPTRDQLRLAVQETVTAAPAVRRRRQMLQSWRLGFDLIQREVRGIDQYLNVPAAPDPVRRGEFGDFARWAAARRGVELPGNIDFAGYEQAGQERLAEVRRLTVLRHLFRRPMEMWLVYDRALYLEERGYQVEVGTFCERRITPRNLLIRAVRS